MTSTTVDGVQRRPNNGLKVVILGAGVAGLQAALELWRQGCSPVVLEKADKMSALGELHSFPLSPSLTLLDHV